MMRLSKHARFLLLTVLLVLAMLLSLTACGEKQPDSDEPYTLRIVTNTNTAIFTEYNPMFDEVQRLAEAWKKTHEGASIELETLPTDEEARENRIAQLRTEILAGGGPDIFLLFDRYYVQKDGRTYPMPETLIPDVAQAMGNGMFYDISPLYDADESLDKAGLCIAVMDAGTVGGRRYVLPLRYTFPVVYADEAALKASNLDLERMAGSVTGFWDELLSSGDAAWAKEANPGNYLDQCFPFARLIDYTGGQPGLTEEALAAYIRQYRQLYDFSDGATARVLNAVHYVLFGNMTMFGCISEDDVPLSVGELAGAVDVAAVAKARETELTMFPLRGVDGSLNAYVPLWGAVSANCRCPEAAYAFLRQFLQKEHQWDTVRSPHDGTVLLPGNGWPVRYTGAAERLWISLRDQLENSNDRDQDKRVRSLRRIDISDGDILPLLVEPDSVHLPTTAVAGFTSLILDQSLSPEDAAREFIDALQWHLDEG